MTTVKVVTRSINTTQALILGSLHSGPKSGAQILEVAKTVEGFWPTARSQVYRDLHGLEKQGHVHSSDSIDTPRHHREVAYGITESGARAYSDWKACDPHEDQIRSEWMLRLALCEHDGSDRSELCIKGAQDRPIFGWDVAPSMLAEATLQWNLSAARWRYDAALREFFMIESQRAA